MTLRKLFFAFLTLAVLVVSTGCDSSDDDDSQSDTEIFAGTWTVANITDSEGDKTELFAGVVDDFTANLRSDGTFSITVDYNDQANAAGQADVNLAGNYTVEEATNTVTLNVTGVGALPLSYNIVNNDRIELSGLAGLVNLAFGTDAYQGTVVLTIQRV